MPFQYTNPGVAAAEGIEQYMTQRAASRRQQLLDEMAMRKEKRAAEQADREYELRLSEVDEQRAQRKLTQEAKVEEKREKELAGFEKDIEKRYIPGVDIPTEEDVKKALRLGSRAFTPKTITIPREGPMPEGQEPPEDKPITTYSYAGPAAARQRQMTIQAAPEGSPRRQALEAGVEPSFEMFKSDEQTEVHEYNPRTNTVEKVGTMPKGSVLRQEPAPRQPVQPVTRYSKVEIMVGDRPILANYDSLTGKYSDPDTGQILTGASVGRTAEQRNTEAKRELTTRSINSVRALSSKVITQVGPAQRAQAIREGAEAVLGRNPNWRTYRDSRMALAGNLAVLQQGSRPSDADIKAIWLPLVPDVFADTTESAALKWEMIATMSGTTLEDTAATAPIAAPQSAADRIKAVRERKK